MILTTMGPRYSLHTNVGQKYSSITTETVRFLELPTRSERAGDLDLQCRDCRPEWRQHSQISMTVNYFGGQGSLHPPLREKSTAIFRSCGPSLMVSKMRSSSSTGDGNWQDVSEQAGLAGRYGLSSMAADFRRSADGSGCSSATM